MIDFNGVHNWFKKLHVLNNINLHVNPGRRLSESATNARASCLPCTPPQDLG